MEPPLPRTARPPAPAPAPHPGAHRDPHHRPPRRSGSGTGSSTGGGTGSGGGGDGSRYRCRRGSAGPRPRPAPARRRGAAGSGGDAGRRRPGGCSPPRARQHGAASGATRAKTCRTQHASAAQGGEAVGCPHHPLAAGWAGHGCPANPALQRDAGCSPHAAGRGHRQPQRGGRRGDAARLEPAARGQRDDGGPGCNGAGGGSAAARRALAAGHRQSQEGDEETLAGGPRAQLPHPQPDGEGARPGPGLQLGRDRALQVLQRLLPPGAQQLRPDAGQPPAAAAHRPRAAGAHPQPPLLPAHPLRGRVLHGRAEHVADGGEALGGRVQLHRLRGGCRLSPGSTHAGSPQHMALALGGRQEGPVPPVLRGHKGPRQAGVVTEGVGSRAPARSVPSSRCHRLRGVLPGCALTWLGPGRGAAGGRSIPTTPCPAWTGAPTPLPSIAWDLEGVRKGNPGTGGGRSHPAGRGCPQGQGRSGAKPHRHGAVPGAPQGTGTPGTPAWLREGAAGSLPAVLRH